MGGPHLARVQPRPDLEASRRKREPPKYDRNIGAMRCSGKPARRCLKCRTRAADAPYVPEFQRGLGPVVGVGVPAPSNGYLSGMSERVGAVLTSSSGAGRTHVENILASLFERRAPSASAPLQPQAPSAGFALPPAAAAAAAAASAAALRPAPPAGPAVNPQTPGGTFTPSARVASPASLPRSAGAAAAARALAALVPGPSATAPPPGPIGGAQGEPLLLSAAASSAARALSSLAGASARAASLRATPAAGNGPTPVPPATGDELGSDDAAFGPAPSNDDEVTAGTGPDAGDSEVPQADPHLDDILPAKSKSFFRRRH